MTVGIDYYSSLQHLTEYTSDSGVSKLSDLVVHTAEKAEEQIKKKVTLSDNVCLALH